MDESLKNLRCPDCGLEMIRKSGKHGAFWGCREYPHCKGTRDSLGKSRADRDKEYESKDRDDKVSFKRRYE